MVVGNGENGRGSAVYYRSEVKGSGVVYIITVIIKKEE